MFCSIARHRSWIWQKIIKNALLLSAFSNIKGLILWSNEKSIDCWRLVSEKSASAFGQPQQGSQWIRQSVMGWILSQNQIFWSMMFLLSPGYHSAQKNENLCVTFTNNLHRDVHFDNVIKKAGRRCFINQEPQKSGMDEQSLLRVYSALIRPALIYGFQCFCNAPKSVLRSFSRVEEWILRVMNADWNFQRHTCLS